MSLTPTTALVVSTYNWVEALALILTSIKYQRTLPDELIIADDGSTQETKKYIDHLKGDFPVPIIHVWHEDKGFRKSKILNMAIAKSNSDYIIQIDGDCILHPYFISDHKKSVALNTYLYGSRVSIQKEYLTTLFRNKITRFGFFANGIKKRSRNLHIPVLMKMYKPSTILSKKLRGCNLSYWKNDFIKINGYNEEMEGWGREDSEMVLRLHNNEVQGKRIRYGGIVYHIHHTEKPKDRLIENDRIQTQSSLSKITYCKLGIDQYL